MNELFGAPAGKLQPADASNLKNEYSNLGDRSVEEMAQSDRVQPRQMPSGVMRGTQRIVNSDGSYITLGEVPDGSGTFGIGFFDTDGNLTAKSNGVTDYKYDLDTNKNYYQNGQLPDGSYGAIFVKSGYNVTDVIS